MTQESLHRKRPRRAVDAVCGVNMLALDDDVDGGWAHVLLMITVGRETHLAGRTIVVSTVDNGRSAIIVPSGGVEFKGMRRRHDVTGVRGDKGLFWKVVFLIVKCEDGLSWTINVFDKLVRSWVGVNGKPEVRRMMVFILYRMCSQ